MRRSAVLLCLFSALAACFILYTGFSINGLKEQVTVTETVLAGDRDKAAGVTITSRSLFQDCLHWETRYDINESLKYTAAFRFEHTPPEGEDKNRIVPFLADALAESIGVSYNFSDKNADFYRDSTMGPLLLDAVKQADTGDDKHIRLPLNKYFTYYPVSLQISHPDYNVREQQPENEKINSYFRLPVYDAYYTADVLRNSDGEIIHVTCEFNGSRPWSGYYSYTNHPVSLTSPQGAYLTLCSSDDYAMPEDMRGIHFIPYVEDTQIVSNKTVYNYDMKHAHLAYPLAEDARALSLTTSTDEDELLLITYEQGRCYLTVIDRDTMKKKQKLSMGKTADIDKDPLLFDTYQNKSFYMAVQNNKKIHCFVKERGRYRRFLTDQLYLPEETERNDEISADFLAMDYSDNRLALGMMSLQNGLTPLNSVYLLVYESSGLVYAGYYENSLDQSGRVYGQETNGINIHWGP